MAKIISQLNKTIQGTMGDLIFYQVNGQNYLRSRPSHYRDKKSEKQMQHRKKFQALGQLARIFKPAMRFLLNTKYANQTNTFSRLNWKNISIESDSVIIDYKNLILCNQIEMSLRNLNITTFQNKVRFEWEPDFILDDSFLVLCAVYCSGLQQVSTISVVRNSLSAEVFIPDGAGELLTYTFTYRK